MAHINILVPDIGDFDEVTVIELLVQPGDTVKAEQSLITVESDKASMEIPSSHAGVVKEIQVALGGKVKEGSVVLMLEVAGAAAAPAPVAAASTPAAAPAAPAPEQAAAPAPAPEPVDVEATLAALPGADGLNWRTSIVDLMKLLGIDSSLHNREDLAKELGYTGALDGSAEMNIWLHKATMQKLAENGGKVPASMLG